MIKALSSICLKPHYFYHAVIMNNLFPKCYGQRLWKDGDKNEAVLWRWYCICCLVAIKLSFLLSQFVSLRKNKKNFIGKDESRKKAFCFTFSSIWIIIENKIFNHIYINISKLENYYSAVSAAEKKTLFLVLFFFRTSVLAIKNPCMGLTI